MVIKRYTMSLTVGLLMAVTTAHAATIIATVDPVGPINLGDTFTVNLAVSGWDAADGQVDAVDFNVDFDTSVFEFVPGSGTIVTDGTEFLADNQHANYDPQDESDDGLTGFGRYIFGMVDDDGSLPLSGSQRADGPHPLGSFQLKGTALGTGSIDPKMGTGDVFSDPDLFSISPAVGVSFTSATMEVVPEPASALMVVAMLGGVWLVGGRRFRTTDLLS